MFHLDRHGGSIALAIALASLAACGGGGGGGGGGNPPANAAPVMPAVTFNGTEETDLNGQVVATDSNNDPLTFTVVTAPAHGTFTSFTAAGAFTYRPNANAFGADTFAVRANDGHGGAVTTTMTINVANVNDAPAASNDRIELASAATLTVNVLANDTDVDNDALTVSIIEPPLVGSASVGANNTVSITGLPAGFRGLTRFRYRVTDAAAVTSDAIANVFVDTAAFRVVMPVNGAQGGEIAISDFTGEPRVLDTHTPAPANALLASMRPADNGSKVAFYRVAFVENSFVRQICTVGTGIGAVAQCYQIPDDRSLMNRPPSNGPLVYSISADGRWIAAVLVRNDSTVTPSLYVIDTNDPTVATPVGVVGAEHAVLPTFSNDSRYLYFIGSDTLENAGLGVYRVTLGTGQAPLRLSAPETATSRVDGFAVSPDDTRVVFQRVTGDIGAWFVETAAPGTEHRLSHSFEVGESIQWRQGMRAFANPAVNTIAYVVWDQSSAKHLWMADVSASNPDPREVAVASPLSTSGVFPMVRPDGGALVYSWGTSATSDYTVYEASKTPASPVSVGHGIWGGYDASGDTFVVASLELTPSFNVLDQVKVLARTALGAAPIPIGNPAMSSLWTSDTSYTARGAMAFGQEVAESALDVRPMLVNFAAPASPLPLSGEIISLHSVDGPVYYLVD